MGQYYKVVNVSKKEYMESAGCLKLMETAWIENEYIGGSLMFLLLDRESKAKIDSRDFTNPDLIGSWHGHKIVMAGDYAKDWERCSTEYIDLYNIAERQFTFIHSFAINSISTQNIYIINYDTKEYIFLPHFITLNTTDNPNDWIIHPLPLLIANSNGSSGSYYGLNESLVGRWCGDKIGTSYILPEGYNEFLPYFQE